ncbi:ATP synthase subunit I [bacterium]|nr:ATP synthase subunit I [bacterium]
MPDLLTLTLVMGAGAVLGMGFYGGLWWTVRRGFVSPRPALWFAGSLILRMSLTLYGLYLIGGTAWPRWLAAVVGFALARLVVQRATAGEARHAA